MIAGKGTTLPCETTRTRRSARAAALGIFGCALALTACGGPDLAKENENLKARLADREAAAAKSDEASASAAARSESLAKELDAARALAEGARKAQSAAEARASKAGTERDRAVSERDAAVAGVREQKDSIEKHLREIGALEAEAAALAKEIERLRFLLREAADPGDAPPGAPEDPGTPAPR